jgi:hypothetical protein
MVAILVKDLSTRLDECSEGVRNRHTRCTESCSINASEVVAVGVADTLDELQNTQALTLKGYGCRIEFGQDLNKIESPQFFDIELPALRCARQVLLCRSIRK